MPATDPPPIASGLASRIAVVTDSTAALPEDLAADVSVVALKVAIGDREGREGVDITPDDVAAALAARQRVGTSRPAPADFTAVYERLLDGGAAGVFSVHLSAELSGTLESANLAAKDFGDRVVVFDSRSTGMALGFVVAAAEGAGASGADVSGVRAAAEAAIGRTTSLFYVDTLEFLRRGGRIGAASALLGTALSVKPILGMSDGVVVPLEKVRTASRALARMVDRAVEAAGGSTVDVAVQHVAAPERAGSVAQALARRVTVRRQYGGEVGAVLAAHAGPGLVCVVVHRVPD
jgi:DegV family protein with EDD domain